MTPLRRPNSGRSVNASFWVLATRGTVSTGRCAELPDVGRSISEGESFGSIESVKAVSELFAPMSGEVIEVNPSLRDHPEAINQNPHSTWMLRLRLSDPDATGALLESSQYRRADSIDLLQHICIPQSKHRIAGASHEFISLAIVLAVRVLASIDLDDQPGRPAGECGARQHASIAEPTR